MNKPQLFKILPDSANYAPAARSISVELTYCPESQEAAKLTHDLRGSATAIRLLLAAQQDALKDPTEREQKKAQQLLSHVANLAWAVEEICRLLSASPHHEK